MKLGKYSSPNLVLGLAPDRPRLSNIPSLIGVEIKDYESEIELFLVEGLLPSFADNFCFLFLRASLFNAYTGDSLLTSESFEIKLVFGRLNDSF